MTEYTPPFSLAVCSCLAFCAGLPSLLPAAIGAADKPNVVVLLTDDQGWGDLSLNGNTNLSTPNIDSLARDGASFDRFFVCPVCSPTRAEFLTGRYHPRSGVYSTSAGGERMNLDEMTIADTFKAAGYVTGAFGKWHNGMQYPYHPNGRGFDEYYGFCSGHWGDYFSPPLEHNGQLVQGDGFIIDDLTNQAMAFMEENKDKPFFAYVPYNTPHSPMQVPDRFWDKFKDKELAMHNRDPEREDIGHVPLADVDAKGERLVSDFDNPWKEALEQFLSPFLAFFFPDAFAGIDWKRGYESLDKELQQIIRDAESGPRLADKLFKVWRLDGEEAWVLVHVEVQNRAEDNFSERMYTYNYRIYDRYRRPVVSLAVLGDDRRQWHPTQYGYELWGCNIRFQFPSVKLLEYASDIEALIVNPNPFAAVTLAHIKTMET